MLNFSALPSFATATRTLLALFLLVLRLSASAQAPRWQSAQAVAASIATINNYSVVSATAVDAAGNVYVTGTFTNTVVLGFTTLTSLGGSDVFVAKFNPNINQFVWARQAGGAGGDYAAALAVSGTSVYIAGEFGSPTADFGSVTLTNASTSLSDDMFVAKLSDAGSFVWAQRAGGPGQEYAEALAVSGTSVYVAGEFSSLTVGFGPATLTNASNNGYADVFVAKLDDAGRTGSFAWAQQAGGTGFDYATALAVRGTGVFVAGKFISPTASFGSVTLTNADANKGSSDMFVARLTDAGSTGSFAWAQRAGGTDDDYATALAVSGTSVYVTGGFDSTTAGFGPVILTNSNLYTADVFVAKLNDAVTAGNFVWVQQAGGTNEDKATALAVSGSSVYITGYFDSSTAGFGSTTLTNVGSLDVFVAKLTDAGNTGSFAWALRAGGTGYDQGRALALSGTSVYVAGYFDSPLITFGGVTLPNPSPYFTLGFLATLYDPTLIVTATKAATGPREAATLFPHPARRTATLRLPAGTVPAPLILTDALGRAVRCYPTPAGAEATLDLQGLPAGLYLLRGAGPAQRLQVE